MIAKHFKSTCDLCPEQLSSLEQAKNHYRIDHQVHNGYLECCDKKFKKRCTLVDHVRWHLNPNVFQWVSSGSFLVVNWILWSRSFQSLFICFVTGVDTVVKRTQRDPVWQGMNSSMRVHRFSRAAYATWLSWQKLASKFTRKSMTTSNGQLANAAYALKC